MKNKGQAWTDIALTVVTISLVIAVLNAVFKASALFAPAIFTPYINQKFEPKPLNAEIEIFNVPPQKAYIEIGEIKAYGIPEKTRIEKITKKAKEIGADAIIIKERKEDATIAIAIRYK